MDLCGYESTDAISPLYRGVHTEATSISIADTKCEENDRGGAEFLETRRLTTRKDRYDSGAQRFEKEDKGQCSIKSEVLRVKAASSEHIMGFRDQLWLADEEMKRLDCISKLSVRKSELSLFWSELSPDRRCWTQGLRMKRSIVCCRIVRRKRNVCVDLCDLGKHGLYISE